METTRKKTTVYLDPELLRAVKVLAASSGQHDYEVVEAALRQYLATPQANASRQALEDLLDQLGGDAEPGDDEALTQAYDELHAVRQGEHQR